VPADFQAQAAVRWKRLFRPPIPDQLDPDENSAPSYVADFIVTNQRFP
jgi:hypothetical protein